MAGTPKGCPGKIPENNRKGRKKNLPESAAAQKDF